MQNNEISKLAQKLIKKHKIDSVEKLLLGNINMSDTQWIVMEIYKNMVKRITPSMIIQHYNRSRFLEPCTVSPKQFAKLELDIYTLLSNEYIPIELSPVMPIGSNAVVAGVNQGNVLSTVRNIEVTADTTMALTIETASRLLANKNLDKISLCANQRCLRLQKGSDNYGFTAHFKIFAMCNSWTKNNNNKNQVYEELNKQLGFYLKLLSQCKKNDYKIKRITVELSDTNFIEELIKVNNLDREIIRKRINDESFEIFDLIDKKIKQKISSISKNDESNLKEMNLKNVINKLKELENNTLKKFKKDYPEIKFVIDIGRTDGLLYYNGPCFKIYNETDGNITPLADGGVSDWLSTLMSDKRRLIFTSGFGTELLLKKLLKL